MIRRLIKRFNVFRELYYASKNYNPEHTNHLNNADASLCKKSMDKAWFSFEHSSDFDYFLNELQNKIITYRKLRAKK